VMSIVKMSLDTTALPRHHDNATWDANENVKLFIIHEPVCEFRHFEEGRRVKRMEMDDMVGMG
jgi:hypothetical protein